VAEIRVWYFAAFALDPAAAARNFGAEFDAFWQFCRTQVRPWLPLMLRELSQSSTRQ